VRCPHRRSQQELELPGYSVSVLERQAQIRGDVIGQANQRVAITATTVVLAPSTGMAAVSIRLVVITSRSTGWANR
jgi:hypothetical protein